MKTLIVLILSFTLVSSTWADSTTKLVDRIHRCDNALAACQVVVHAQDEAIEHLKAQVKDTTDKLVEAERQPIVPTWAWILLGLTAGATAGYAIHK